MDRTIPLDKNATCDICGKKGALDFFGDFLCPDCAEEAISKGIERLCQDD